MRNGWKIAKLGDLLQKTELVDPRKEPHSEFKYVDVSSVNNKNFQIESTSLLKGKEAPSRARKLVRTNDVIFATVRPTLKRIAIIPKDLNGQICSTGFFVLRAKEVNSKLFYYYLQTDAFVSTMEKLQRGASYPAVTDSDIKDQSFSYPISQYEQNRIVELLDDTFDAIDKAKGNIEMNLLNARQLFESYVRSIFLNKDNEWQEKKLSDIATTFARGKSKHRPRNDERLYGGNYPFIQTGDVRNSNKHIISYAQTYNEVGLAQSRLWPKGTICITIAANIAETGILDFDSCFPDSVIGLIVDPTKANQNFTYYVLQYLKTELKQSGKGSAQDNINLGTFENQYFPFPKPAKQKEIAEQLDFLFFETKRLESVYTRKLDYLDDLKHSILQKAFSGELTAETKTLIA